MRDYPICPCADCNLERGHDRTEVRAADPGGLPCNDDFYCGECPDCLASPDLANRVTPAATCSNCGRRLYAPIWVRCPDCHAVLTPEATAPEVVVCDECVGCHEHSCNNHEATDWLKRDTIDGGHSDR